MMNSLLIILPILIPLMILGHFFAHLLSRQPDKYERIYRTFSYVNSSFTPGSPQRFARPCESAEHLPS